MVTSVNSEQSCISQSTSNACSVHHLLNVHPNDNASILIIPKSVEVSYYKYSIILASLLTTYIASYCSYIISTHTYTYSYSLTSFKHIANGYA